MAYVTTPDGVHIFYKDWASGPPVMFHRGWPLSIDDCDVEDDRLMGAALRHGVEQ